MNKFIFNFTPTGMLPTREMTPHVPVLPGEIIAEVAGAASLGVNMVHLHARDPLTGKPTHRKEIYAEIIEGIRARCPGMVIAVSTSGRDWSEFEKRSDVLDLEGVSKPDFASLTLSSLNFNNQASINAPDMIQALARRMLERDIRPEMEVFDSGMINYAHYLIRKELLLPPFYFNLILGNIACAQADAMHFGMMVRDLPAGAFWSAGGVGNAQLPMNAMALLSGGGVRVGLEDTIWFDADRTRLATNRDLLVRVREIATQLGSEPFSPHELREQLNLKSP